MSGVGWGGASWGGAGWGGSPGPIAFSSLFPHRENVLRLGFTSPPYASGLLDSADSLNPKKYTVRESGVGLDSEPARAVTVAEVRVATELVSPSAFGSFLDLVLDRAMSAFPCVYDVDFVDIHDAGLSTMIGGTAFTQSVFRLIQQPTLDYAQPSLDFSNRQTAASGSSVLGLTVPGEDGDYASDAPPLTLKKRVIRRLCTRKGSFAHLPNYGVGIPQMAKQLARPGVLALKAAEAEGQIAEEPDVRSVTVTATLVGSLAWFRVRVVPRVGKPSTFNVPFATTS